MEPNRGRWLKLGASEAFYSFAHPQVWKGGRWVKSAMLKCFVDTVQLYSSAPYRRSTNLSGQTQKPETFLAPFLVITAIPKDKIWETAWELLCAPVSMCVNSLWVLDSLLYWASWKGPQGQVKRSSWCKWTDSWSKDLKSCLNVLELSVCDSK